MAVVLRALEPGDLEYLYRWENEPEIWRYGDCGAEVFSEGDRRCGGAVVCGERFSRLQLAELIENQRHGVAANGQLRLVVCRLSDGASVGFVDLFEFDAAAGSAGVGILICDPGDRRKGYGQEALGLLLEYARRELGMRALWCTAREDNSASIALFSRAGFVRSGSSFGDVRTGEIYLEKYL